MRYAHDDKNSKTVSNNFITSLYEDHESKFWVGTLQGLDLMNKKTSEFTNYKMFPDDTSNFGNNIISSLLEDRDGRLWVGSFFPNGIHQFDAKKGSFSNYLIGVAIRSIYEDADGMVWVGADDGLYQYNKSSDIFSRFIDPSSSAGIDNVLSIIEDNEKKLWIGTSDGIIQLNRQRNQTTLYGKNYKIDGNEFTGGVYKSHEGKLYFGTSTGYYVFDPAQLKNNSKPPHIIFSGFHLADKIVRPGNNSPLTEPLSQMSKIRLPHNENVFSFDFVAIDYTNSLENRYLFMLENYDNAWHQAGSDRRAGYYNVPPGKYVFKVKASNSDGVWAEKSISIIITPPWWRTWWAYTFYVLLFLLASFIANRLIRNRIIEREKAKARERELAQAKEIEKAYTELKSTQATTYSIRKNGFSWRANRRYCT